MIEAEPEFIKLKIHGTVIIEYIEYKVQNSHVLKEQVRNI